MQLSQQVFVPLDSKIGMQAALHQHAGTAEGDRLIDLMANLVERTDVGVGCSRPAVERAERANYIANVRVIDVAVDDVGDDVVGMTTLANFVGGDANARQFLRLKQSRAFS